MIEGAVITIDRLASRVYRFNAVDGRRCLRPLRVSAPSRRLRGAGPCLYSRFRSARPELSVLLYERPIGAARANGAERTVRTFMMETAADVLKSLCLPTLAGKPYSPWEYIMLP